MAEESVSELYALIQADIEQFEKDIDYAERKLDEFKEKEVAMEGAAKEAEAGFSALAIEGTLFASVLGTIWDNVKKNSGGVQALTDMIWGYMGAGIDTFLSDVLIPAWDLLKEKLTDVDDTEKKATDSTTAMASVLKKLYDDEGKLKDYLDQNGLSMNDLKSAFSNGKSAVDDYGNTLLKVGDDVLVFDNVTEKFIGILGGSRTAVSGMTWDLGVLEDKVKEASEVYGAEWTDVFDIVRLGYDEVQRLLEIEGGEDWMMAAVEAADEVWRQLHTGKPLSADYYQQARDAILGKNTQGPISVDDMVDYYMSGQGG